MRDKDGREILNNFEAKTRPSSWLTFDFSFMIDATFYSKEVETLLKMIKKRIIFFSINPLAKSSVHYGMTGNRVVNKLWSRFWSCSKMVMIVIRVIISAMVLIPTKNASIFLKNQVCSTESDSISCSSYSVNWFELHFDVGVCALLTNIIL